MKRNLFAIFLGLVVEVVGYFVAIMIFASLNPPPVGNWDLRSFDRLTSAISIMISLLVPAVIVLSCTISSIIAKSNQITIAVVVVTPIVLVHLFLDSFDIRGIVLGLGYLTLAALCGFVASRFRFFKI